MYALLKGLYSVDVAGRTQPLEQWTSELSTS